MKVAGVVVGGLVVVAGRVWTLQGAGVLVSASPMTGVDLWIYLGILTMVIGAVIVWLGLRRSPRRPRERR